MQELEQFIGQNYYTVYDALQVVVAKYGLSTSLVEGELDYNIDVDPGRLKVYIDPSNGTIVGLHQG